MSVRFSNLEVSMDKRSALVTAGGLTVSFVAGIAAVSFDWGLLGASAPSAAAAPTSAGPKTLKPIVKHRTIVVHKKAPSPKPSAATGARTVTLPAPAPTTVAPSTPVAKTSGSPAGAGDDGGDSGEHGGDD